MHYSITARIAAAIAAICTTTFLFTLIVSLSEPEASNSTPHLALATESATTN